VYDLQMHLTTLSWINSFLIRVHKFSVFQSWQSNRTQIKPN